MLDTMYRMCYTVCMASSETKTQQIGIRVTPAEKLEFERAAQKEYATASEWFRRLAHAELKKRKE